MGRSVKIFDTTRGRATGADAQFGLVTTWVTMAVLRKIISFRIAPLQ